MTRPRTVGVTVCVLFLVGAAGCLGFLTGDSALSVGANATAVDDAALSETGYQVVRSESPNRTMNVSIQDQSREVQVSSEVREYNRSIEIGGTEQGLTRFSVYTTPGVSIAGESINPIDGWSKSRLIELMLSSGGGVEGVQFESNRTVRFLGEDRTVSEYSAQAASEPAGNVTLHFATVAHDGEYVVVVAAHPERLDERDRIDTLLAGLEHPPE